ncbi:nitroreductase family protein [Croceicoccus sediminis]|uniref:nitroreductase family protein n=1 Tax=Croceicoccus sediminis TaxID=2571150 RepID=UPI00118275C8|nr:nitroreductase family protein [Croceicoccus sediminis]
MSEDRQPFPALPDLSDEERVEIARAAYERLRTRHSCRSFTDKPVPREVIEMAIAAAGTAPSGANHQPWHFAVVGSPEAKRAIREAAEAEEKAFYDGRAGEEWLDALAPLHTDQDKPYLETAPWLIVVFAQRRGGIDEDHVTQNYYVTESVGIACGLLLSTLHEAGLATLTHTPAPMHFLREICQRPKEEKAMMIVVVGHPAADATVPDHATIKKPLSRISSWI